MEITEHFNVSEDFLKKALDEKSKELETVRAKLEIMDTVLKGKDDVLEQLRDIIQDKKECIKELKLNHATREKEMDSRIQELKEGYEARVNDINQKAEAFKNVELDAYRKNEIETLKRKLREMEDYDKHQEEQKYPFPVGKRVKYVATRNATPVYGTIVRYNECKPSALLHLQGMRGSTRIVQVNKLSALEDGTA